MKNRSFNCILYVTMIKVEIKTKQLNGVNLMLNRLERQKHNVKADVRLIFIVNIQKKNQQPPFQLEISFQFTCLISLSPRIDQIN